MVKISLQSCGQDNWSIFRSNIRLFSELDLCSAIKLSRELARDEHARSGRVVSVEMPGKTSALVLATYSDDNARLRRAVAA